MQKLSAIPLVCALACGGGGGSDRGGQGLALARLGLKMDAPAGSTASDGVMGGVLVEGPGLTVTVDEALATRPKLAEEAEKEAEMYNPQQAKVERLADGFVFTFENSGDLGKNYWVQVRREIGGRSYWCESTTASPEQQATATAACLSLKQ